MNNRRFTVLFMIAFFISSGALFSLSRKQTAEAELLVKKFLKEKNISGVAVAYGEKGKILFSKGFGYADIEQNVKVSASDTLFRIGSVSKPMTAHAIAVLMEEQKLDPDKDIREYVPDFPVKKYKITTRQLGGHLAGIRHYRGDEFLSTRNYPRVNDGLVIFMNDPLMFKPDTRFSYTSYGWNLISAVIESASGTEFLKYMQDRVFKPLGMNSTVADHVAPLIKMRSRYYILRKGKIVNAPFVDNSYKWAGGGFLSTADDLVRFGFGHIYPRNITRKSVVTLWTPQKTLDGKLTNYGIGWFTGKDKKGRVFAGHGGGSVGGTTYFRVYPKKGAVIVLIANMSGVRYGTLPEKLVNLLIGKGS